MFRSLPAGALSLTEAIRWLANRKYDGWQFSAWPELRDAIRTRRLRAYVLDSGNQSYEADPAQFAALEQYDLLLDCREFVAAAPYDREITYREMTYSYVPSSPTGFLRLGDIPSLQWQVRRQKRRIPGPLFILERDLEKAFGEAPETIEAKCRDWLAGLPESPRLTKKKAREEFTTFNGDPIPVRAFKRAWQESVPVSWRRPGAPKIR
jgi:hypothetical protein